MRKEIGMKVKELIEKLKEFNGEMECWWEDVVDGNHCTLESLYVSEAGLTAYYDSGKIIKEERTGSVLFFSPYKT